MNILITGGDGYIAKHLRSYLKGDHFIFSPDKRSLNCFDSTQVSAFFENHDIDVVIHTALTGRNDLFSLDPMFLSNGLMMWRNLYNNRHRFGKLIQFGSAYEFSQDWHNDMVSQDALYTEFPKSSYGYCKNLMARNCIETENFFNLRIFGNFHYTENNKRFFKILMNAEQFIIERDRQFDYFNLDDILKVVKVVIDENLDWDRFRDINLVYSKKLYLYEQALLFCEIQKINPDIVINNTGFNLTGNSTKLDLLGIKLDGLEKGFEKYNQL